MAQKIGQTLRNSIKKNRLFLSNDSGVIHFFMKFEIKMGPFYLKTQRWRRFSEVSVF
jgi:hypothetical protein